MVVEDRDADDVLALDEAAPVVAAALEVADVVLTVPELDTLTEVESEALRVLADEDTDAVGRDELGVTELGKPAVAELGDPGVDELGEPGEPAVAVFQ